MRETEEGVLGCLLNVWLSGIYRPCMRVCIWERGRDVHLKERQKVFEAAAAWCFHKPVNLSVLLSCPLHFLMEETNHALQRRKTAIGFEQRSISCLDAR